jgi:RHS repeat-associated protein
LNTTTLVVDSDGGYEQGIVSVYQLIRDFETIPSPPDFYFYDVYPDSDQQKRYLTIKNTGEVPLNWQVSDDVAWVTESPSSGILTSLESVIVTLTLIPSETKPGINGGNIYIETGAGNETGKLGVTNLEPAFYTEPDELKHTFDISGGLWFFKIISTGGSDLSWSIINHPSFIKFEPSSGYMKRFWCETDVKVSLTNEAVTGVYNFTIATNDGSKQGEITIIDSSTTSGLSKDIGIDAEDKGEGTRQLSDHEVFPPPEEQMPVPPPSMYRGISKLITRYLYTGREYNIETGMYYYRARVMNPKHGRFTGKDIVNHLNLYTYVSNSPILFIDPYGLVLTLDECKGMNQAIGNLEDEILDLEHKKDTEGLTEEEQDELNKKREDHSSLTDTYNNNCTGGAYAGEAVLDGASNAPGVGIFVTIAKWIRILTPKFEEGARPSPFITKDAPAGSYDPENDVWY